MRRILKQLIGRDPARRIDAFSAAGANPVPRGLGRRIFALTLVPTLLIVITVSVLVEVQVSDQIFREIEGQLNV
ncbi:MAG: hypothetical protein KC729_14565, partial [Candidatus Eisenbacteria bacterium]|nr:hypothetical protein [Candidatus Eisenbacteria bacterium]